MKRTLLFLLCVGSFAGASSIDEQLSRVVERELRLRLADGSQEARTTSVNFIDVSPPERQPVVSVISTDAPVDNAVKIVIDAGHGGDDLGAKGGEDLLEKDAALKISRLVRSELARLARQKDFPVEIRLTRDEDRFIPLKERARIANEWEADLFVSVHLNSSPLPRVRGFEVYFMSPQGTDADANRLAKLENAEEKTSLTSPILSMLSEVKTNLHVAESSAFAEAVYQAMSTSLLPNKRGVRQAPFAVLGGTEMPSLLIEVGYLTNAQERDSLKRGHYLKRIANAISQGILRFALGRKRLG